jgi:hypothetical protein
MPIDPADWPWLAGGGAIGGVLGWFRGRIIAIWRDPVSGALQMRGSATSIYILLALVVVRIGLHSAMAAQHLGSATTAVVNGSLLSFVTALFIGQSAEMTLRARTLNRPQADVAEVSEGSSADG